MCSNDQASNPRQTKRPVYRESTVIQYACLLIRVLPCWDFFSIIHSSPVHPYVILSLGKINLHSGSLYRHSVLITTQLATSPQFYIMIVTLLEYSKVYRQNCSQEFAVQAAFFLRGLTNYCCFLQQEVLHYNYSHC